MIRSDGGRIVVEGAMTLPAAAALLAEGNALLNGSLQVVDLAAVTEVDSSGLAVVFGWLREAKRQGRPFSIANPPEGLRSLADVYGVADQLPLA